ncbi:MAG: HXXEE domain-containing protein [Abditibacteriota bacterium]|nr:HXXEE domain-containing protein [Abditibacteriota bacterium]
MKKIKYYSLEIYTLISLGLITYSAIWIQPDIARKIILAYVFLFVLHEWEEGHYPGGFPEQVSKLLTGSKDGISPRIKKESRFYTGIYLLALTVVPYFLHEYAWLVLPAAFLGLLEGAVHVAANRLFGMNKLYSPGMITAECELALTVYVFCYLGLNHYVSAIHYALGFLLMLLGFMCMQRQLVHTIGRRYRDLPAMVRERIRGFGKS